MQNISNITAANNIHRIEQFYARDFIFRKYVILFFRLKNNFLFLLLLFIFKLKRILYYKNDYNYSIKIQYQL